MKNRISKIFITILVLFNCQLSLAQEQFEFNVTQIEVYENGNKFNKPGSNSIQPLDLWI